MRAWGLFLGWRETKKIEKWDRNILPNQLSIDLCLNVKSTEKSKELVSHNVSERSEPKTTLGLGAGKGILPVWTEPGCHVSRMLVLYWRNRVPLPPPKKMRTHDFRPFSVYELRWKSKQKQKPLTSTVPRHGEICQIILAVLNFYRVVVRELTKCHIRKGHWCASKHWPFWV